MDNPQEFTQERMAMALSEMRCARCYRKAADLRNIGFNPEHYREQAICFWYNKDTFECNNG
jgi:hypothetical protein